MDNNPESNTFFKDKEVKPLLLSQNLTADDLKRYLILVFGSLRVAGQKAGFSDDVRIHQILAGYKVPQDPVLIKRYSDAWNIQPVVLTQLFERLRGDIKQ